MSDDRGPLRLTRGQAASWFSLHSEDRGREIIIIDGTSAPVPDEIVAARQGYGRWETGLFGGQWPMLTSFAESFLKNPPRYAEVTSFGVVLFHLPRGCQSYDLRRPVNANLASQVPKLAAMIPADHYVAVYIGGAEW